MAIPSLLLTTCKVLAPLWLGAVMLAQDPRQDPMQDPTRTRSPTGDPGIGGIDPTLDPNMDPTARGFARPIERHPLELNPNIMGNDDPFRPGSVAPSREFEPELPDYVGFPIFPPSFQGYSGYPGIPDSVLMPPGMSGGVLPLVTEKPDDWPSWVRLQLRDGDEEFAPDRAMLLRDGDRVWYLDSAESAFEPLAFHDRLRVVRSGARAQVRTKGSFQVVFHGGSRALYMGRCDVLVEELDVSEVRLRFYDFTRVWLYGRDRATTVALPDGSLLTLPAAEEGSVNDIYLERDGRMAMIYNPGPGLPKIRGPFGETTIPTGHRVQMALEPRVGLVRSAGWRREGELSVRRDGTSRVAQGAGNGAGGAVEWSGVRVRLPVGATLQIDPLGGVRTGAGAEPEFPEMRNKTP